MTTTTTITLPAAALIGIANLTTFTPALKFDRDMAPILATVQVTLEAFWTAPASEPGAEQHVRLTAIATDRYMVGRYVTDLGSAALNGTEDMTLHLAISGEPITFLLSLELLKRVKPTTADAANWTITIVDGRPEHYTAQHHPTTVTVSNGSRTIVEPVIGGNFPRVDRLIPEEPADLAPVYALNATHLARLSKVVDPTGLKEHLNGGWKLEGTTSDHPTKPGPVVWTHTFGPHSYTVLQQPLMPLR